MSEERRAERMAEERAQGSGSLALADDFKAKPLSEGKRDLDKGSVLNNFGMINPELITRPENTEFQNAAADRQFNLEAAIKNVEKMSNELKKLNVESQLLLCDLILNFNHPMKANDLREADEKTWSLTD